MLTSLKKRLKSAVTNKNLVLATIIECRQSFQRQIDSFEN